MAANAKLESKVVRDLARFLSDERLARRWRVAGQVATYLGAVLVVAAGFAAWNGAHAWLLLGLALTGGFALGLGMWFSTFVAQWPIVRPFIDAERVRRRAEEMKE